MGEKIIIEWDGEEYLKINNKWIERTSFLIPKDEIIKKLYAKYIESLDLSKLGGEQIYQLVCELKENKVYGTSLDMALRLLDKYNEEKNVNKIKSILPVITSIYRGMKNPKGAISIYNMALEKYGIEINSQAIYTSLASAYCDLGNLEVAKMYCKKAYSRQTNKNIENLELSSVFQRIKNLSGE